MSELQPISSPEESGVPQEFLTADTYATALAREKQRKLEWEFNMVRKKVNEEMEEMGIWLHAATVSGPIKGAWIDPMAISLDLELEHAALRQGEKGSLTPHDISAALIHPWPMIGSKVMQLPLTAIQIEVALDRFYGIGSNVVPFLQKQREWIERGLGAQGMTHELLSQAAQNFQQSPGSAAYIRARREGV